ncbi:MAG: hypothetical protein II767_00260 [Proteobacteria bacterium]|nr:hypothetical protein [Pseudomonadota bacterium]
MQNPELLGDRNLPEVKELVDEYPCFQSARMLYVKNLRNQGYSNYGKALRETAVYVTNRTKLFFLLDERVIIKHDAAPDQIEAESEVFDFTKMTELAGFTTKPSESEKAKTALDNLIENATTVQPYFNNLSDTFDLNDFRQTFGKKDKPTPKTKAEHHAELLVAQARVVLQQLQQFVHFVSSLPSPSAAAARFASIFSMILSNDRPYFSAMSRA